MKIESIVEDALIEDLQSGDITSEFLDIDKTVTAELIAKEDGILAGIDVAFLAFKAVDPLLKIDIIISDGEKVKIGDVLAEIEGSSKSILKAERVALNFMQRMSGIASKTRKYVDSIKPYKARLLDTRKTTPLLRELEKYAVRMGGGFNHRFGLFDMIMLKENHIRAAGSITKAVQNINKRNTTYKIEVEVTNLEEFKEAVETKIDRIMLDNMSIQDMHSAVTLNKHHIELEASGNVTQESINEIASTGVDFISSGALTHSYRSLDITLLFKEH
ncbi:MAG: carboxylating nicotinate-nucleotide diphosphorylase [Candidatus Cloacimonadota bacterium]|nr:carboxylating nicotinate-nucleotide diphosphorylase [Candidatus Cloacimonadota bacterium]